MLACFPTPYPNEILYSVLARYALRTGYTSPKMVLEDLYGSTTVSAVIDLPSHIDRLIESMPRLSNYTSESLIYGHTLFPFYAMFLPKQRAQMIIQGMKGDFGGNLHTLSGIMASSIPDPLYLRFCPKCNQEDLERYGELYWHRLFQIPGVLVCPFHKILLQDSSVPYRGHNKHAYIPALPDNCIYHTELKVKDKRIIEKLAEIALDCCWVLKHQSEYQPFSFKDRYVGYLAEKGLVTPKGFVHQLVFLEEFKTFYDDELLQLLHSRVNEESESIWLKAIVRKHRKVFHPIRHILMMRFFAGTTERFFSKNYVFEPFGKGPWPCLNPTAGHYLKSVIDNLIISTGSKTRKPVGTFKCSCGFEYSRTGPDQDGNDRYRIGRIKQFGAVWESQLKVSLAGELSLRKTARQMGCDPKTIVKYALRQGLDVKWKTGSANYHTHTNFEIIKNNDSDIERHREAWLNLIDINPNAGITKLRKMSPADYIWLYRHDKEWLLNNSPRHLFGFAQSSKVNWEERDKKIIRIANDAVNSLLHTSEKPIRISIGRIGFMTNKKALLEKHLDRLPITKDYLLSVIEDREQFRRRRIKWAARLLNSRGEEVKAWKIIRTAGLRSKDDKQLTAEIDQQVIKYSIVTHKKQAGR